MNLLFFALILATYRITRLLVADSFPPAYRLREWIVLGTDKTRWSWLGDLWQCPFCMSVWVAGVLTLIMDRIAGLPYPVLAWGAVAGASALLASWEGEEKE